MSSRIQEVCKAVVEALSHLKQLQPAPNELLRLLREQPFGQYVHSSVPNETRELFISTARVTELLTDDMLRILSSTHTDKVEVVGCECRMAESKRYGPDNGWYFTKDLACRHSVDRGKLDARLRRHREANDAMAADNKDWREVDVDRQNAPRYLYRESDTILSIIEDLKT